MLQVARLRAGSASQAAGTAPKALGPKTDHYLTSEQLADIDSIPCLEKKQKNPLAKCDQVATNEQTASSNIVPPWSIANYPMWTDPQCKSNGEYFCDPDGLLSPDARKNVTDRLRYLRRTAFVDCPMINLGANPYNDKSTKTNFFLGIALAKDFPETESNPESLQQFGMETMARWTTETAGYQGPQIINNGCGNIALLIVLPTISTAFLASPSCKHLCKDNGGDTVNQAVVTAFDVNGLEFGLLEGIETVGQLINVQSGRPVAAKIPTRGDKQEVQQAQEESASTFQRIIFALLVVIGLFTLFAFTLFFVAPSAFKDVKLAGGKW